MKSKNLKLVPETEAERVAIVIYGDDINSFGGQRDGFANAYGMYNDKWIRINDDLPKDNTMVLVWQKNLADEESSRVQKANYLSAGVFTIYPTVHTTIYKKTKGYRNYDLEGDICELTHWMHLPQKPTI